MLILSVLLLVQCTNKRSSHQELFCIKVFFSFSWCWLFHRFSCLIRTGKKPGLWNFFHRSVINFKERVNPPAIWVCSIKINFANFAFVKLRPPAVSQRDVVEISNPIKVFLKNVVLWQKHSTRAYFRKAGHACGMDEKGYFLVNLGQLDLETSLNSMQIPSFWSEKLSTKFKKYIACRNHTQYVSTVSPEDIILNGRTTRLAS